MRNLIILSLLILLIPGCTKSGFTINGKILGAGDSTTLYLERLTGQALVPFDSVKVNADGYFLIEGNIDIPEFFLLKTSNESFLMTLIEPDQTITIESHADSLGSPTFIDGSPGTSAMYEYNKRLSSAINDLGGLSEIYNDNIDSPDLDEIMNDLDSRAQEILEGINAYTKEYIDNNLRSMVAMVALYQQVSPGIYVMNPAEDLDYFKKVDSILFGLYPESEAIISFHEQIISLVETIEAQNIKSSPYGIGDTAPDFTLPDTEGKELSLSSTRGKVVLLDFWAAWCPPCRQESPNLVKAYKKYHDSGLEIFQVSLDQTREAWLKGIKDDKLDEWIHVSDLKYWESMVVELYKFSSIPANFLLDPEGRIIAKDLRGDDLIETLELLFNK